MRYFEDCLVKRSCLGFDSTIDQQRAATIGDRDDIATIAGEQIDPVS